MTISVFVIATFLSPKIEFKGRKIRTVATLDSTRWVNNTLGEYIYYVGNHRIKKDGNFINTQVIGDKYEAYYDSEDSTIIEIIYSQPIFLDKESTFLTEAEIISTPSWYAPNRLKFAYTVNGKEYIRFQYISEVFESKYPNIKEGQKYLIKYCMKNPQRSIMNFDKPIK